MAEHKDQIKGGLADKKKPSDFDASAIKQGIKVEMEHTDNKSIAREISMDHLAEDPNYYKKLKEVEKKDMLEITPDGKQEIVEGKEPLKKDPKKKKNLKDKWNELKKALDNKSAFMDLAAAQEPEEQPQEEEQDMGAENGDPQDDENTQLDPEEMMDEDSGDDDEIPADDEMTEEDPASDEIPDRKSVV